MKNPFEEYVTEKTAISMGLKARVAAEKFMRGASGPVSLRNLGRGVGGAAMGAVGMGTVGLAGLAAQKLVDAVTKSHDFRQMLEFDQNLAQMHAEGGEGTRLINQSFSTLRNFNPAFSKDPMVASALVTQMVANPSGAGGFAVEHALSYSDKAKPSIPIGDMMMRGATGAFGAKKRE